MYSRTTRNATNGKKITVIFHDYIGKIKKGDEFVAALNHVNMWSEHGWVHVTAEQAAAMHPGGTVSAHSGLFMCDLCGQYVTLTDGDCVVRYFRHSAEEANKNCPERTFGASYVPTYTPGDHELPIKLVVNNTNFQFELGLLHVPLTLLKKQSANAVSIKSANGESFVYSFDRLNSDTITYLSIGNKPAEFYTLDVSTELAFYWPKKVRGIPNQGAIFDAQNGKMIPLDADVQIHRKYNLVTKRSLSLAYKCKYGVKCLLKCEQRFNSWKVYEIEATELNEDAAKFFLEYHCRLTDIPLEIQPIWPIHIETPYVIKHNCSDMIMHLSGNRQITPKAFPTANIHTEKCPYEQGQVIKVNCKERQQLISAGNANVLQYLYLWRESLQQTTSQVFVSVTDAKENEIVVGEHNELPVDSLMRVETHFDGEARLFRNEKIIEKIKISAHKRITIDSLRFGISVQILQGLDNVWSCRFVKAKQDTNDIDTILYNKLISYNRDEISVPHSFGNIALRMKEYPKVTQWIFAVVRKGYASEKAINYLKKYMTEMGSHQEGKIR